jgi:pimeloyl-ACP methyl ester carboxylesterase
VTAAVRSRDVLVDGVCSPVWESGPAGGDDAVVFVHGNPGPAAEFMPLLQEVGVFARALAPDLPGFGRADKPRHFDYTIGGYARHLGGVLDQIGVARAHLVGHDFGGPWALQWAAAHPDRCASVVLINTGVLPGYRWHFLGRVWRRRWLGEASLAMLNYPILKATLRVRAKRTVPDAAVRTMCANLSAPTRRAVLELYRATDMASWAAQIQPQLGPLRRRPVLVIWGTTDIFIERTYAARQREMFGDAQIRLLDESGHFPHLDDPGGVTAAIVPFLRSHY